MVTSAVAPAPAAGVGAAVGTLTGVLGCTATIAGVPVLAAILVSGLWLSIEKPLVTIPALVRFSCSYFMRARAAGSASGIGRSICWSLLLASSTNGLSGYSFTTRA